MTRQTRAMWLALAIGTTTCLSAARAATEPSVSSMSLAGSTWSYGDRTISYTVHERQLRDTPAWSDPSHEPPPLSIGQAVDISKQELSRYVPEVSAWALESVSLTRFDEPDRWYYIVTWQAGERSDHQLHIPVLMNGLPVALTWSEAAKKPKQ